MIEAKQKSKTKTVWAGMYGGHYDQIVFFSTKPKKIKDGSSLVHADGHYDCLENEDKIIGDMSLGDFQATFECDLTPYLAENGRPKAIEIIEVFRIKLTGPFDEDGRLPFHADWK